MKIKSILLVVGFACSIAIARAADPAGAGEANNFTGSVTETMNAGGYTYVQVATGGQKIWAATAQFAVKPGDTVSIVGGMPMANFHSQSLNRDFALVYFTGSITVAGAKAEVALPPGHPPLTGNATPVLPPGHPSLTGAPAAKQTDLTGIARAAGGRTIQEIFADQKKIAGQTVSVRGKVVKYNSMVMGKNWLHLQDGSGSPSKKDNDLTVTTSTSAKVGDTVLVTGIVTLNKDFGAGYKYTIILDDAQVTVE